MARKSKSVGFKDETGESNMIRFLILVGSLVTFLVAQGRTAERPNIVVIMADDLGLGDVSFHVRTIRKQTPIVETPILNRLAEKSLWFTDGHSATAFCAPTRYAVVSGNKNYRSYAPWGVWSTFGESAFVQGHATLGTVVRDAGYQTGFVGKWHLGGDFHVPETQGIYRGKKNGDLTGRVDMTRMIAGGPKDCGFDYDFTSPCRIQGPIYLLYENQVWSPLTEDSEIFFERRKRDRPLFNLNDSPIETPTTNRIDEPAQAFRVRATRDDYLRIRNSGVRTAPQKLVESE